MTEATQTTKATKMTAGLTVGDLDKSIRYYAGLGFEVEDRWEADGKLLGVMLRAGEARLGLSQDDWKKGRDRIKGVGMRLWIGVAQDVDGIAARAKSAGVKLDAEPYDTEWGSRAFDVTDPDGFKLTVSTEG